MVNKKSCWVKINNGKYINKKRKGTLYIFDDKTVNITIDTVKIDGIDFTKTTINSEFKTKAKAEKFAHSYMKKQGEC
ncbi:MAG: hypothetical protein Q8O68_00580 [Candidatus Daviesbacteria bacterium]|nr:hypothetical protein [Candidatus Daviesbacteria bacterium]